LADQQLNGANPRRYDFRSALVGVEHDGDPTRVLAFAPEYLGDVLDYYAPGVPRVGLAQLDPNRAGPVYVLVPQRLVDDPASSAAVGTALSRLDQNRSLVSRVRVPNVEVWEYR